ncbi:uncharacterized protein [Apostichopus japonicus]|uniref:uncharacterized protein n=1 Tax=Stichopus japonicus TaxID=307972 RepID=UPI003AB46C4B
MQMMDDQEGFLMKILPIKGRAIFTKKKFEIGDFLLTYKGELVNATEGDKRDAIKETGFRFFFRWKHQKLCVDASEEPRDDDPWKFGRLVNHARSRKEINSKVKVFEGPDNKPQLQLFATRHIPADEEILYDYGLPFSYCFPPPAFFRVPEEIPQKENENFESDSTYAPESDHSDSQLSQVIPLPCPFSRTCRGLIQETSPIHEDGFPVEEEVNLQLSPAVVPEPCNSDSQLSEVIPLQHPYRQDSDAGNGDLSDLEEDHDPDHSVERSNIDDSNASSNDSSDTSPQKLKVSKVIVEAEEFCENVRASSPVSRELIEDKMKEYEVEASGDKGEPEAATETTKKPKASKKRKLKVYRKRKLLVKGIMDKEDSDDDTVNMSTNIHQKKDVLKKKYSSNEDKEFTTASGVQLGEVPESCNLDSQMSEVVSLACPFSNICHGVTQDTSPFHANEFPIEGEVDLQLSPAVVPESCNSDSQLSEVIPLQHPYRQDSDAGNGDLSDLEEDHDPDYSVERSNIDDSNASSNDSSDTSTQKLKVSKAVVEAEEFCENVRASSPVSRELIEDKMKEYEVEASGDKGGPEAATETTKKPKASKKRKLKVYKKRKLLVKGIIDEEDSDDDTVNKNTNIHQKKDVLKMKYSSSVDKEFTATGGVQLAEKNGEEEPTIAIKTKTKSKVHRKKNKSKAKVSKRRKLLVEDNKDEESTDLDRRKSKTYKETYFVEDEDSSSEDKEFTTTSGVQLAEKSDEEEPTIAIKTKTKSKAKVSKRRKLLVEDNKDEESTDLDRRKSKTYKETYFVEDEDSSSEDKEFTTTSGVQLAEKSDEEEPTIAIKTKTKSKAKVSKRRKLLVEDNKDEESTNLDRRKSKTYKETYDEDFTTTSGVQPAEKDDEEEPKTANKTERKRKAKMKKRKVLKEDTDEQGIYSDKRQSKINKKQIFTEDEDSSSNDGDWEDSSSDDEAFATTSDVQLSSKSKEGNRKWDSKDYCLYCDHAFAKIFRHCSQKHDEEKLVVEINALPLHGKDRKAKIAVLRNRGNLKHNKLVWDTGEGQIKPRKRPTALDKAESSDYLPCEYCDGSFKKDGLWKHQKVCSSRGNRKRVHRVQAVAKMFLPTSECASDALNAKVLTRMQADLVAREVRKDPVILTFGTKLLNSHPEDHHALPISQRMRDVAKLLIESKKIDPSVTCMRDCINPDKFDTLVKAVKNIAGFDETRSNYKTPSYARNIGYDIDKVAAIVHSEAIKANGGKGDSTLMAKVQGFQTLKRNDWSSSVSSVAQYTLDKRSINKPKLQPVASDIQKLTKYLKTNTELHKQQLKNDVTSTNNWNELSKMTLAHINLFNRRRSGEIERLRLDQYEKITTDMDNIPEEVFQSLGEVEKALVRKFHRVEIPGKRRRTVPILMTESMVQNVDLLISTRSSAKVASNNPYVFARPYFDSQWPVPANDCLRKYSIDCGASHPELIRSSKLRKHVATMSQILSLKENELDLLAAYMGHDIRIHRDFYRLPESTLQVAKVSKILIMMEEGTISKFKGKALDEIDVSLEGSDENNSSCEELDDEDTSEEIPNVNQEAETSVVSSTSSGRIESTKKLSQKKSLAVSSTSCGQDGRTKKESQKQSQAVSSCEDRSKRNYARRKPWTCEEKKCVLVHFKNELESGQTPNYEQCIAVQQKHPLLKGRKWSTIKDFVVAERRRCLRKLQNKE